MNLFKGMQINQISNNTFSNLQQSYGQINPNPNGISNILVGPVYNNNNQIKAINQNMINNNNKVNIIGISNNNYQNNPDERYVGQLINGLRHGKGTVYYKNNGKIKYEGDFKYDKYEGYGELYDEEGTIKYKGFFKNNKYEGNGKLYEQYFDYIGLFVNGLKHGKGIKYYKNGEIYYEGYFINDNYGGKEKNIMIIITIQLNMKVILRVVNMKEKEYYTMNMEMFNIMAILKIINLLEKEEYMVKMEILYMKVIL